jgi:hypothetical protein
VDADMHERAARLEDARGFTYHRRISGHVRVDHHRDHGGDGLVPQGQPLGIGLGYRQPSTGVAQHPLGEVDAHRCPAQFANQSRVDARAAADLQAGAIAFTEQVAQEAAQAQRVAVSRGSGEELRLVQDFGIVVE